METKRIRTLAAILVLFLGLAGTAVAETYYIDPVHSSVEFQIRHIVSRVRCHFNDFSGTVQYDPAKPEATVIEATIDTASLDTGNERRDGHVKSADFLDVEKYPQITFKSTKVEKKGELLHVTGDLTIHGVTKSVVLPVEVLGVGMNPMAQAPSAGFTTEVTVKRSDYGVNNWTDPANILGDDVMISINVEATAKGKGK